MYVENLLIAEATFQKQN